MSIEFKNVGIVVKTDPQAIAETATQTITLVTNNGCTVYLDKSVEGILEPGENKIIARTEMSET